MLDIVFTFVYTGFTPPRVSTRRNKMKMSKTEIKEKLNQVSFPVTYAEAIVICESFGVTDTTFHKRPDFDDLVSMAHIVCVIAAKAQK